MQPLAKLNQLSIHPETTPTSTVAMFLMLRLCNYNKQYILKIEYSPYFIAKELQLFWKIDSESNLFFIFNCYEVKFRCLFHFTPTYAKV